jgi:lipopolysaccharide transport system ATP-binding protein
MSNFAVHVDRVSKQYQLGTASSRHDTLRDQIVAGVTSAFRRNRKDAPAVNNIWSLKDVSFNLQQGEAVAIIGRNGAGKSTLLKILSRITHPTSGSAEIRGRLASLLEVGTGFHGELTGRENIFLNGAILGMKKAEIKRKFDEIVAFSEVEKFIDTPVKRYSSGMYVRLAFAVAAHLEPEILIVDEVLAVGDHEFQKKCLGKMDSVAKAGRTVMYVSHNMESVVRLCPRAILLEHGRITKDGQTSDVVEAYLGRQDVANRVPYQRTDPPSPKHEAWISGVEILDDQGTPRRTFAMGEPMRFRISFELLNPSHVEIGLVLSNHKGQQIAAPNSRQQLRMVPGVKGRNCIECRWDGPTLTAKPYSVRVDLGNSYRVVDSVDNAVSFEVQQTDYFGTGRWPNPTFAVVSQCKWRMLDQVEEGDNATSIGCNIV